jgi:phage tail sheath protein FI
MTTTKRAGVYVSEFLTPNATPETSSTSTCAFIGSHHRGPTEATLINSWTEFVSIYGGFPPVGTTPSELPFSVYQFFSNGGRQAYICRVLGTGAVTATVNLMDRAGTPLATLRADAKNAGAWGNNLRVAVTDGTTGRFNLLVYYGGTTAPFLVESFTDLSMIDTDPRYVETIVNSATAGSAYITVTDLDSATAAPGDTPAVQAGTALTTGVDGAAASTAQLQAALTENTSPLDLVTGMLTINIPGETSTAVLATAATYASGRGDSIVIVDPVKGNTQAQASTYAASLTASSYLAVYYPWVLATDPSSSASGATRLQAPGGFVLGKIAENDAVRGVWKAPAGLGVKLNNALGLERKLTNTELDALNASNVNAIRHIPGSGIVVMGARTLATTAADKYVNVRRTLNYIKENAISLTGFAVFENNDQLLWNMVNARLTGFLTGLWQLGGLKGGSVDQAFYVKCDAELNTPQVIASGIVKVEIGVALQIPAEFVVIRIGQWEGGQQAAEA